MIKTRQKASALLFMILVPLSFSSSAQLVDVSGCRTIEDSLQRFDCYEKLDAVDPVSRKEESRQNVSIQPAQPARTERPSAIPQPEERKQAAPEVAADAGENADVNQFGRKAVEDDARLIEGDKGKSELIGTIASLEERRPNLWLVTLTNGQRWLQMQNKPYFMEEGETVRIYPTIWGSSYRLTAPRLSGYIQVRRLD